jgi:hypothetical protein
MHRFKKVWVFFSGFSLQHELLVDSIDSNIVKDNESAQKEAKEEAEAWVYAIAKSLEELFELVMVSGQTYYVERIC